MIRHSPGQMTAELSAAATIQREATHQRVVFAWGQTLFTELGGCGQLEIDDALAYEDKVAAQVHALEEAAASLRLLYDTLEGTSRPLKRHLQSLRT